MAVNLSQDLIYMFFLFLFGYLIFFEKLKIYFKMSFYFFSKLISNFTILLHIYFNAKIKISPVININITKSEVIYHVQNFILIYPMYFAAQSVFLLFAFLVEDEIEIVNLDFLYFDYYFGYLNSIFYIIVFNKEIYPFLHVYNFLSWYPYLGFYEYPSKFFWVFYYYDPELYPHLYWYYHIIKQEGGGIFDTDCFGNGCLDDLKKFIKRIFK